MTFSPTDTLPAGPAASLHSEIAALAADCVSAQSFFSQALRRIAEAFDCPYAALYVQHASDVIEDRCHRGPTDPQFWESICKDVLTDVGGSGQPRAKLLSARNSSLKVGMIAVPMFDTNQASVGGLSIVARMSEEEVRLRIATFESLAALMMQIASSVGSAARQEARETSGSDRAVAKAAACESLQELALSLTTTLRRNLACQQVAIGLVSGQRVRIVSISGQDRVDKRAPGVTAMTQAMEECLDAGEPIVVQEQPEADEAPRVHGYRLHRQWHDQARNAPVASIPLTADGKIAAILSVQHRNDAGLSPETIGEIRKTIEPFAAAMLLLERANRGLVRHTWESARNAAVDLVRPGGRRARIVALSVVAALTWLTFGTLDYDVAVTSVVRPTLSRQVAAPYAAALASVEKKVGQRVTAGEVLCLLDTRDLVLERKELLAQLAAGEQQVQSAMAGKLPVDARLAELEVRVTRARLATIEDRISRAVIRSPIDGFVVTGDLHKQIGCVLEQGTPLFEVASPDEWKLELQLPDHASAEVNAGLSGRFAPQARPEKSENFELQRVLPNAVVHDEQVVFIAEARMPDAPNWLRPGMEGVARVDVGPRPAWWVLFHSVVDYCRLHLWL